ncbi:unnamed protein product [Caenorhabditis auriculariae]|uniref:Uncharacterized protein n=1 Tax=Caenorhabditis auriculariae TaxID=2777116 RepID=A0A8S1H2V2_9PELO|nr:unnamed protein product [Caenorhabditis auriculariae]
MYSTKSKQNQGERNSKQPSSTDDAKQKRKEKKKSSKSRFSPDPQRQNPRKHSKRDKNNASETYLRSLVKRKQEKMLQQQKAENSPSDAKEKRSMVEQEAVNPRISCSLVVPDAEEALEMEKRAKKLRKERWREKKEEELRRSQAMDQPTVLRIKNEPVQAVLMGKIVDKVKERKMKEQQKPKKDTTTTDAKSLILLDKPRIFGARTKRSKKKVDLDICLEEEAEADLSESNTQPSQEVLSPARSEPANRKPTPAHAHHHKTLSSKRTTRAVVTEDPVADERGMMLKSVRNYDNKGFMYDSENEPFWSTPMEPTDEDLDGLDEGARVTSETLDEVMSGRVILVNMPNTPIILDPIAGLNDLRTRNKFFLIEIVFSNTVRSVVNISAEIPQSHERQRQRRQIREENGDFTQVDDDGIQFETPDKCLIYSRTDPRGTASRKVTVPFKPSTFRS